MDVQITPRRLRGTVTPPPSKSVTHRLIIAAGLAGGESIIENVMLSQDIKATLGCIAALGGTWEMTAPGILRIRGFGGRRISGKLPRFDCGESGSTLRFFLPIALAVAGGGVFTGRGRLMERPQQPYWDLFDQRGITHRLTAGVLTVRGRLTPGVYYLPGNVSSQFFTGLLLALPLLSGPSRIIPTTAVESAAYLHLTLSALSAAGVTAVDGGEEGFGIVPASYRPFFRHVEADWSQAAFWYAVSFLGGDVVIRGLDTDSLQGDQVITALTRRLSAPGDVTVDVSGCPDLLPPLAVMAAGRSGVTVFTHAGRLRLKESDRLSSTAALLRALGVWVQETRDSLFVTGSFPARGDGSGGTPADSCLTGGEVDGADDHRIVMAAAVASSICRGLVTIRGAEAVNKSYPSFWGDFKCLGGEFHVL